MFQFTAILSDLKSSLWGGNIPVPQEIAEQILQAQENRRVVCTLNNSLHFHCALMPKGDGTHFILVNKNNQKKLGLSLGQEVSVLLEKDESKYGLPMPEEMAEVLKSDPEGDELFHALTPGKQRNLLYIVGKVKNIELRIHKALVVIEHLKTQGGKINFKQLYNELKVSNRQF